MQFTDKVHPIDVHLGLYLVNGQVKVISGCFSTAETTCNMWSGMKHSTFDIDVWNYVML